MRIWNLHQRLSRKTKRFFTILFLLVLFIYLLLMVTLLRDERSNVKKTPNFPPTTAAANSQLQTFIRSLLFDLQYNGWKANNGSHWKLAKECVNSRHIHQKNVSQLELGNVLHEMASAKIYHADTGYKGTQLKMTLYLQGKQVVVFKPKWYERTEVMTGGPYSGKDRHNGEIAAYHLGRLLKFNRSPLVVGRSINLRTEILPAASERLNATFFSRDGRLCVYGKCYYCNKDEPVCGDANDMVEGAVILWLPPTFIPQKVVSPWIRKYTANKTAIWEVDDTYCERVVLHKSPYNDINHPRLLDLIDTAIFDFLIGNADRHHYEVLKDQANSTVLLLDNGKSFGDPYHDEVSILAPLYQCCRIRRRLYDWLREFTTAPTALSDSLDQLLKLDPIYPVLTRDHLQAMDRRLLIILDKVSECVRKRGDAAVLIDDGFD